MAGTIFAPATVRGRSAIAVIRVSGPKAWDAVAALTRRELPPPRQTALRYIYDSKGEILDQALIVLFERGQSATGERLAELHCHGAPVIVDAVLETLSALDGLEMAQPGAFTRRALESGRLDLVQIDGLSDLLKAETEAQRRQAMRVYSGAFSSQVLQWRQDLVHARAMLEATIDFSDDEVPDDLSATILAAIDRVQSGLDVQLAGAKAAERIRDGFDVALIGRPNVGKSTLLNYIADRDVAITAETAGTTRDILEVRLDLDGLPVTFLDTAGLRDGSADAIERIGMARTRARAEKADLRVVLCESVEDVASLGLSLGPDDIMVAAKADLMRGRSENAVSGRTGCGVAELLQTVSKRLQRRAASASDVVRLRHRLAFEKAQDHLALARNALEGLGSERAAEDLRSAALALETVIGAVGVEDLLDEIFAAFCLGK
ncbi:MAG: tRNA uridine-5-carboxymethylaminomethyl(34) synthesis GTPase MnmE [Pseudomonadota bacterium]